MRLRLSHFFFHALRKAFRADDGAFVEAAHDDFVLVARFDLERNFAAVNRHDARGAMNRLADGRRCEMADINLKTNGTFISFEMRREEMTRSAFEKLDDVRRGDDGGHAVAGEFHGVFHVRGNGQFAGFTNSGARFHFKIFNHEIHQIHENKNVAAFPFRVVRVFRG